MQISLVVAVSENGVIGRDAGLPWHLPADLRHFKRITLGHPILMGRRTHESIGRPLPGRANLILSRDPDYVSPGCTVVRNWTQALEAAGDSAELMVIGGEAVYLVRRYPGPTGFISRASMPGWRVTLISPI